MKGCKVKIFVIFSLILLPAAIFAQQSQDSSTATPKKFALVIGNSNYRGLTPLDNPVNDATDMSAVLAALGFDVDRILDGTLQQMQDGVTNFKDNLGKDHGSYGFFFYAGHGIQSNGENYLIPVDANIPSESYLPSRALAVQAMLDELNYANNALNVIVLDACRDNPFGWSRSASRGLAIVNGQPADSIIVYATSAGKKAADGDGRNGLFTSYLLENLMTPGLDVNEVFRLTGADVSDASNKDQVPAIYNQFFGTAYLGDIPEGTTIAVRPTTTTRLVRGAFSRDDEANFWSIGASAGTSFSEPWMIATIRGTVAPFKYQFLEAGLNAGLVSTRNQVTSYYSLTPYVHYAFFWPFNSTASGYVGAGIGYKISQYQYYGLNVTISSLPADASIGIFLFNFLDISFTASYPLWTDSGSSSIPAKALQTNLSNKLDMKFSVGYSYRF